MAKAKHSPQALEQVALTTDGSGLLSWFDRWRFKPEPWPFPFGRGCCHLEFMTTFTPTTYPVQLAGTIPRFPVDLSNILFVGGAINHQSLPLVLETYKRMLSPKWVVAVGACAGSGGLFKTVGHMQALSELIPVDVFIPGCPPEPQAIWLGLEKVVELIRPNIKKTKAKNSGQADTIAAPSSAESEAQHE